jgi:hypothetical protein
VPGGNEYPPQFVALLEQRINTFLCEQFLVHNELHPEARLIGLFNNDAQLGNEGGSGLCNTGCPVICRRTGRTSYQLGLDMPTQSVPRQGQSQLDAPVRERLDPAHQLVSIHDSTSPPTKS